MMEGGGVKGASGRYLAAKRIETGHSVFNPQSGKYSLSLPPLLFIAKDD
jgi:hypothetical protein